MHTDSWRNSALYDEDNPNAHLGRGVVALIYCFNFFYNFK